MFGHNAGATIPRNQSRGYARYASGMNNPVSDRSGRFAVVQHGVLLPPNGHDAVSLAAWAAMAVGGLLCWGVILSMI